MRTRSLRSPKLIGGLGIVQEHFRGTDIGIVVLLPRGTGGIEVDILTQVLLHVVARTSGATILAVELVVGRRTIVTRDDYRVGGTCRAAIVKDVSGEARVTSRVGIIGLITTLRVIDGVAVSHRERIHQVLRGVGASIAIERGRVVVGRQRRFVVVGPTTPDDLRRIDTSLQGIDLGSVAIPSITILINTKSIHTISVFRHMINHYCSILSSLLPSVTRACAEGRAGCHQDGHGTNALSDTTTQTSTELLSEDAVVIIDVGETDGFILGWDCSTLA